MHHTKHAKVYVVFFMNICFFVMHVLIMYIYIKEYDVTKSQEGG